MDERRAVAEAAAERGGRVAMEYFGTDLATREKTGAVDVVTEADEAAQAAVVEAIQERYPDATIVGEEGDAAKQVPDAGPAWIVDPIDGTTNFVHGLRQWGTAVAFVRDRIPVASAFAMPALGEQYVADPWDTVAGGQMIRRAGGTVTDLDGESWRPDSEGIVATNGTAHQAVLDRLADGEHRGSHAESGRQEP